MFNFGERNNFASFPAAAAGTIVAATGSAPSVGFQFVGFGPGAAGNAMSGFMPMAFPYSNFEIGPFNTFNIQSIE